MDEFLESLFQEVILTCFTYVHFLVGLERED